MIVVSNTTTVEALAKVAALLTFEERQTYTEMTGLPFVPDNVAAQLWMQQFAQECRYWTFMESCEQYRYVAAGGYVRVRPGVWSSWFLGTEYAWKERGKEITKVVADCITDMFEDPAVRRLETVTLASLTHVRTWYERLGLHYESTLCKASASGQDLVLYTAVKTG